MFMRRIVKLSLLTVVLALIGLFTLLSASVYTFNALSDEATIAELRFERVGDKHFLASLRSGDGCRETQLEIFGDQWRVDAQFLKWKYWALLFGLDSQYRLERFEGRYASVAEENSSPQLAHSLEPDSAIDVLDFAESLGAFNFLIDATYGSSTFQDIDTDRTYYVYRTQTAIITRSEARRRTPPRGEGQSLAVEVNRGCATEPGVWERFTLWSDDKLSGVL